MERNTDFLNNFAEYILDYAEKNGFEETTKEEYATFSYMKHIKIMKFTTKQFFIPGFGNIMLMKTDAMGGMMKLLTVSFTPSSGIEMPYLLMDMMSMKKKKACFVEYYDCTGKNIASDTLLGIKEKYANVSEYEEKDAWYIKERMPESLIKGGKVSDKNAANDMENKLEEIAKESFGAYMSLIKAAEIDETCLDGLKAFKGRMQNEGNPSDATMRKVFGEEGARKFFDEYVMPVN